MQKNRIPIQKIFLNRKKTFRFNRYHNEKHTVRMVHRGIHLPDMVFLIGGEKMEKVTLSVQELANCLGISLPQSISVDPPARVPGRADRESAADPHERV
jgi:hypothetical protein